MKEEEQRTLRLNELRAKHEKELGDLQDNKLEEAIEEESKRLNAEKRVFELEAMLEEANAQKYGYEAQIDGMRAAVSRTSALEAAVESRVSINQYPKTPDMIAKYFYTTFSDHIDFSDSAKKSLKECRLSPDDLWKTLYALSMVMWELMRNDNCPDPYKAFKNTTGIDASRSEGKMTRKDEHLMEQFQTIYQGRVIDIEPHITFAREAKSIHFGFDIETGRIVVGHCGEHLNIYSTQKLK